jgi:hypothetical protein
VGAGIGGGLSLNPLGKVNRTEKFTNLKVGAAFGPLVGVGASLKYTDCGNSSCPGGGRNCLPTEDSSAGCTLAFISCKDGGGLPSLGSIEKNLRDAKNGKDVFKWSASASATVGACAKF